MKTIGIIGGMGPETTSKFYLELIRLSRREMGHLPSIIIESLPISFSSEENFVKNGIKESEFERLMIKSAKRFEEIGVNLVVIPSNTAHFFIEKVRESTSIPVMNIIKETTKLCLKRGFRKVGVLGTEITMKNRLYEKEFEKFNIEIIKLDKKNQEELSNIIHRIVTGDTKTKDQKNLENLMEILKNKGAEVIILGCTDLQNLIKDSSNIEIIDSMHTLVEATFRKLL